MAFPDFTRIFDLLKAKGWQTAAVAVGCFVFLLVAASFQMPSNWLIPIVTLVMFVSAALASAALLASFCGWLARSVPKLFDFFNEGRKLTRSVSLLNKQERDALDPHVRANEQTFYLSPFTQRPSIPEALRLQALYAGLSDKGIVTLTTTDAQGRNMTIHVTDRAWKRLKKTLPASAAAP
jgi:hypothetical protein